MRTNSDFWFHPGMVVSVRWEGILIEQEGVMDGWMGWTRTRMDGWMEDDKDGWNGRGWMEDEEGIDGWMDGDGWINR